ncbi:MULTISPECIES: TetR/AcrR family transcriptional regulator [unclassified Curtobacterium]|uniref:TetR/AcrR family transcriptional regulator n=1 Tax=unclassified Curtobacterium TaxID=257496 RepID=UPI000DA913B2|nr:MULTISPECIES: TetR/AcrR family transcriptional regulator [unclassified Curtobacterium]PZE76186.1 hypothetical protein DEI82_06765 [Curtobacterium sp. MCBD17_019]WIB63400.1 helix-turn-helix domain-containing protein [Curtobacterium sp. MCBD17_040]WIE54416.1 helix-turn-helix domain-containing protein [Curtobacterium sp. MCBD17_003]
MGIREDQRRRTRWTILLAAAAEFEERGYEATSYASVAARADVAKSLVSYHFASKTDLVDDLFAIAYENGVFAAAPVDLDAPLDELARSTVHVAIQEESNVIARAAMRLQREAPLIPTRMPPPYLGWVGRCRNALTRAIALGQLPACIDVPFEARMLVAQFAGVREVTTALGDHEGFAASAAVGTLDRFATMGASADALLRAAGRSASAIREAGLTGADRVASRYEHVGSGQGRSGQSTTTPRARANEVASNAD